MDCDEMHGVVETVPAFTYQTYEDGKLVTKKYKGHVRILAAFRDKSLAKRHIGEERKRRQAKWGGSYLVIHELEHMLDTEATFEVLPVDAMPSVQARTS